MPKPLAIDLFCGLGGWTSGLLAEGYRVVGFDVERHVYREARYPAQLVLQDVLTIHGSQFKDAALIVASPPCQEFSYMAMPWSKAKEKAAALRDGRDDPKRLTALFDACFRIQREACEAVGHYIPLVVENVCGAQKWVGRARWHFGSFYLWGDVPALMPIVKRGAMKGCVGTVNGSGKPGEQSSWDRAGGIKGDDGGKKRTHPNALGWRMPATSSKSSARKAASAHIAKIPLVLARHIARAWHPDAC